MMDRDAREGVDRTLRQFPIATSSLPHGGLMPMDPPLAVGEHGTVEWSFSALVPGADHGL